MTNKISPLNNIKGTNTTTTTAAVAADASTTTATAAAATNTASNNNFSKKGLSVTVRSINEAMKEKYKRITSQQIYPLLDEIESLHKNMNINNLQCSIHSLQKELRYITMDNNSKEILNEIPEASKLLLPKEIILGSVKVGRRILCT